MMKSQTSNKNHTSRDLQGVSIDHTQQELQEGHEYIMTFKDAPVIIGHELNDEEELLENIELQSSFKQKQRAKQKNGGFNSMANYNTNKILPQYDEEDEEVEKKKQNRIVIQGDGDVLSKQQQLEEIREKLALRGKTKVSLDVQKVKIFCNLFIIQNINSDYIQVSAESTHDEGQVGAKFKKSKKVAGKKRQAEEDILSVLEKDAAENGNAETGLGTREQKQLQLQAERQLQAEEDMNKQRNYDKAINRMKLAKRVKMDEDYDEDEYALIENNLEKQRRLKLKQENNQRADHFIQQMLNNDAMSEQKQDDGEIEVISTKPIDTNMMGNGEIEQISSISKEFTIKSSETPINPQINGAASVSGTQSFSLSQAKDGYTSVVNIQMPSQRIREAAKLNELRFKTPQVPLFNDTPKPIEESKAIQEENKVQEKQIEDVIDERLVGKGVANALKLFHERGMLGKTKVFGRNKDKSLEQQLKSFGDQSNQEQDRVKLEYFDKKGKKLSLKEAFRQMCWKFHGKMPSHRKQEKRKLQEELESKQNQISIGLNPQLANGGLAAKNKGKLGSIGRTAVAGKKKKI